MSNQRRPGSETPGGKFWPGPGSWPRPRQTQPSASGSARASMRSWSVMGIGKSGASRLALSHLMFPSRPPTSWPPTRTNRRSRGGRPASSTRAGAPCSKARRWPTCPRATSCAARRSSSPTDAATPGPRPSRPSSAEATPRSWSPIPADRAGETARPGRRCPPAPNRHPAAAGRGCHPEGRSASGGRRSR